MPCNIFTLAHSSVRITADMEGEGMSCRHCFPAACGPSASETEGCLQEWRPKSPKTLTSVREDELKDVEREREQMEVDGTSTGREKN